MTGSIFFRVWPSLFRDTGIFVFLIWDMGYFHIILGYGILS